MRKTESATPEKPAHGRQLQEHEQSRGLPEKTEDTSYELTEPGKPSAEGLVAEEAIKLAIKKRRRSKISP